MEKLLTAITLLILFTGMSCKKDKAVLSEGNLITNSSFEANGQPSFQAWIGSSYSFVYDVPVNGGQWSLQLVPEWIPGEGFAETFITGFSGNYTFKLTCDTKTINNRTGQIILRLQNLNGTTTDLTKITFNNSTWRIVVLTTNVSLRQSDKLING